MKISIFGLGYVGLVSSAFFIKNDIIVYGFEKSKKKVNDLSKFENVIYEKKINPLLKRGLKTNKFFISDSLNQNFLQTNISIICVGTPSKNSGQLDLSQIKGICKEMGKFLKKKKKFHTFIFRSTVPPGTCKNIIKILEKFSEKKFKINFNVVYNPEFLREGSAFDDFKNPSVSVFGVECKKSLRSVLTLYKKVKGKKIFCDFRTAEITKFMNNAWHAQKVVFANELSILSDKLEINKQKLWEIFFADKKLNISNKYLHYGLPFGGSCLPKDTRALNYLGKNYNLNLNSLKSINASNINHINYISKKIIYITKKYNSKKIIVLGYSFKNKTDDCRESPVLKILKKVKNKMLKIYCYDHYVNLDNIYGENERKLSLYKKHLFFVSNLRLLSQLKTKASDIVLIFHKDQKYDKILNHLNFKKLNKKIKLYE